MASRQSMMPPRTNLTLTEELEKLEQSITLTLQEIDHNFSRAHRIVTSKIIPVVEQYARHSDAVWEGSKFWKEFFEASANVSLSGYEEAADIDETADFTQTTLSQDEAEGASIRGEDEPTPTADNDQSGRHYEGDDDDDITIPDSPSLTIGANSTPKVRQRNSSQKDGQATRGAEAFANYPSPYETLKREVEGGKDVKGKKKSTEIATPGRNNEPYADTPGRPSPFVSTKKDTKARQAADPLLHRVLDKNYRIQATPHTARKKPDGKTKPQSGGTDMKFKIEPKKTNTMLDSSPDSSPIAAPQLRAEIFGTPAAQKAPRTPGLSVQKAQLKKTPMGTFGKPEQEEQEDLFAWNSDSETSDSLGLSPPKTMQFHIPQSRLLQTPAREASKKIVEDILATAGGASVTDEMSDLQVENRYDDRGLDLGDDSPSIVRASKDDLEGDSF